MKVNGENNDYQLVISTSYLRELKKLNLTSDEIIMITFFNNQIIKRIDTDLIKRLLGYNEKETMMIIASLTEKKLITINSVKDYDNKYFEELSLNNIDALVKKQKKAEEKLNNEENIFMVFEKEFGRPLSPIEYEIINGWLETNIKEELIMAALKEATYNGVHNFRYIDKILCEWQKKGIKCESDIKKDLLSNKSDIKKEKLFDYNWLDDES